MSSTAPRVSLRRNGSNKPGFVTRLPPSFPELLLLADQRLFPPPPAPTACRLFSATGDEILPDDYDVIEANDVLYVSRGEPWRTPLPESAMLMSDEEAALPLSRPGAAMQLSRLVFAGPMPRVRWAMGMLLLASSCLWMRAIRAQWLWLLQGASPAVSLMGLAWLITSADETAAIGWLAVPAGMYSAFWGSVAMTVMYALLVYIGATSAVFVIALSLKLVVWLVGHRLIARLQLATATVASGKPGSPMGDWTIGWL